ncbi:MAG: thioredoxin domain-containing protein [Planctomycetaceae bacterium]|jgi:thiol-disulfide isomerase/thioredoxin|nr:thioredoxin domain-containing protein [Planctomycetaceae bacterium]MDG2390015.1 thioredoxin domain-containing protein [Planctomycetaceae bacterium]
MNSLSALLITLSSLGGAPQGELLDFTASYCGPCQSMAPTVEKLIRKGYPIRKVDVEKHPELAAKYGVESIPQFILVINEKPVQRLIGPQSEITLAKLMARIPRGDSFKTSSKEVDLQIAAEDRPLFRRGIPIPFLGKSKEISPDDIETVRGQNADQPEPEDANIVSTTNERGPITSQPMQAAVRLRVNQGGSVNFGTGTIIESRSAYTLIITCGHIFRGSDQNTRISVDYFEGEEPTTWQGNLIRFDDKGDVGLLVIKPNRVLPAIKIASDPQMIRPRDLVYSVGCGNGEPPTRWQMFIQSVDQFVGSSIIECTQAPVSGRSGGGLFNRAGELIGICMAADREKNSGLYAGLKEIYKMLDAASLSALYRGPADMIAKAAETKPVAKAMPVAMETPLEKLEPRSTRGLEKTPHVLTPNEVDAIATALQSSVQTGVTICIEPDSQEASGYQILISNRPELPERIATRVSVPAERKLSTTTSQRKVASTGDSLTAADFQAGRTLKWENLLETGRSLQPVNSSSRSETPVWAQ